ncbi:MAG: hypothetical protein PVF43_04780 [Candidatus Eiseniibacteriota bacterium]
MARLILVATLATLTAVPAAALEHDLRGYVKTFAVLYDPAGDDVAAEPAAPGTVWALNHRARGILDLDLAPALDLHVAYDLSLRLQDRGLAALSVVPAAQAAPPVYRVADLESILWSDRAGDDDRVLVLQNLDRLSGTLHLDRLDLVVGRQAIAWGSSKVIQPTDIVAPFFPNEIDTEDRAGVDAVRARIPLGALSELDLGYVAGDALEWDASAAFARTRLYVHSTDLTLLAMAFRRNVLLGVDATRAVGGAGVWIEAAQVLVDADQASAAAGLLGVDDDDYLRVTAGADYNLASGLYGFAEYHWNGAGATDPADYLGRLLTTAVRDGAVYQLGRHYVVPGTLWQVSALNTLSAQALFNLTDGSVLVVPQLEHSAGENLYLSVGAFVGFGTAPGTMPVPGSLGSVFGDGASVPRFRSEYGAYPDSYYAFVRYYF